MTAALPMVVPAASEKRLPGLLDVTEESLLAWLASQSEKPLRARQLRRSLLVRGAESFEQMTDLPRSLRASLAENFVPLSSRVSRHLTASDGTHKLLVALRDDTEVECVLIDRKSTRLN